MSYFDVLIVGAGHAGAQLAASLRLHDFHGSIAIVGDEPDPPYERPPLSKEYLSGQKGFERILLRPRNFWADRNIELLLSRRVERVLYASRQVELGDGTIIGFGKLVWAAGGAPRKLTCPGHDLAGIHYVRTRSDVDRMVNELPAVHNVVVIGGGYIGLEAAAVLRKLGKEVTLVEAQERVLARVAGEPLSRFYEEEHRRSGVIVRLSTLVECIDGEGGVANGVRLNTGEILSADMVIAGIGIIPSISPLTDAGAATSSGLHVDEYCRTSLTDVFAIGDCSSHKNYFAAGAMIRLECVQNANDQALTVAKFLTGEEIPYQSVPWFWSNQYDLKLQTIGLSMGADQMIVRGDISSRVFSLIYLRSRRVIALDCVNATRDYVHGKALIQNGIIADEERLANPNISLKEIAMANNEI